ncbi:ImmA/IrrE family metallo-endopeptidase [Enterococcus faecalis]|uniref:ImmA/IrrE family metallo-endopeptidase n=1 Tax=Enterococcus faecalis TaxID=1351 RepID=UPI00254BAA30|nr:ImmA/IrrE family metallo-endopeptidase [Enterococcus faecalis]MDK6785766.1 ImmA/IrrE family metallo-endopeptidase [Enterococcus faecalis]
MIFNYSSPDYGLAQKAAYELVRSSNQKELPLSIKKLIKSIPNLHIQKYSVFAKKRKLTLEETYEILDSEEGCLWMRSDGQYIILYNDMVKNTGRIRFTLAHELGHYILKHNEKTTKTCLARYSLTNEEYDIFEKEANYFAKRLLAPIPLIDLYISNWHRIYPHCIEFAFDISFTVANYIIEELHRRRTISIASENHPLTQNFTDFINKDCSSQICKKCRSIQSINNNYCAFCRNDSFIKSVAKSYTSYFIERKNVMIYSKIETDSKGHPKKCPKCKAENIKQEHIFCPYCSTILHNSCLGDDDNRFIFGSYEERPLVDQINGGCSTYLDGGYRYCPACGNETSYYRQGLLKSWEEELNIKAPSFITEKSNEQISE